MLLLIHPALAVLPLPTYPECGEPDRVDLCPVDLAERWTYLSYIPQAWQQTVRAGETATGARVDRAWRTTTGRTDVLISVMDSGIDWGADGIVRKTALNTAELPLPDGSDVYDADGNGVVNISDYAGSVDPTAGVAAADDILDPSDLIATYSDGTDADGNGFVDDIAGWDFLWNDNDPYDDTDFGHGTGEAEWSSEEGGDDGDVGACPNCMVMHLRVGDAFIADAAAFASAVLYATDNDVDIVQVAIGAITRPAYAQVAIDYAWDHGVLVVSSAGDETAWHSNPPANQDRTVYVHGITYSGDSESEASSFLAYENCTNHGPRLDFSVPSAARELDARGGARSGARRLGIPRLRLRSHGRARPLDAPAGRLRARRLPIGDDHRGAGGVDERLHLDLAPLGGGRGRRRSRRPPHGVRAA